MIIWKGWGILVPLITAFLVVITLILFESLMAPETFTKYSNYIMSFGGGLSALAVWVLGKKLNSGAERTLLDETSGEKVTIKANHSLFFINFEYWAIPLALLSAMFIFS
jgi:hypothetical protein